MRLLIITILLSSNILAKGPGSPVNKPEREYKTARKQYLLEYTVFGIDECLKRYQHAIVVDKNLESNNKILVGSPRYFNLISQCFSSLDKLCPGENCIVKKSMGKRIENIKHVDYLLAKYFSNKITRSSASIKE